MILDNLIIYSLRARVRKRREVSLGTRPRAREKGGEEHPPSSFLTRHSCFPRAHILFPCPLEYYSLSQNCLDTFVSPCPLNVGVQGLVTEP